MKFRVIDDDHDDERKTSFHRSIPSHFPKSEGNQASSKKRLSEKVTRSKTSTPSAKIKTSIISCLKFKIRFLLNAIFIILIRCLLIKILLRKICYTTFFLNNFSNAFSIITKLPNQNVVVQSLPSSSSSSSLPLSSSLSSASSSSDNHSIQSEIFRYKRDEEPAPIYGKGIAFWLGEHCETTCNRILFHVWCNTTTHLCECLPEYPVNVENKYCLKALQINDRCEYTESCRYFNPNSECSEEGRCKCSQGFFAKYDDEKETRTCVAYDSPFFIRIGSTTFDFINKIEFVTLFSLIISLILILILSLMVIKLMHKNKKLAKNDPSSGFCDMIPPPPPVILNGRGETPRHHRSHQYLASAAVSGAGPPSLQSSPSARSPYQQRQSSHQHQDYHSSMPTEKPSSSSATAPAPLPAFLPPLPTHINDFRRQSLSSLRSQSSTKSLSSFRSQHSFRINNHQSSSYRTATTMIHCQQQQIPTPPPLLSKQISANFSRPQSSTLISQHELQQFENRPSLPCHQQQQTQFMTSSLDSQTSQSGYFVPNHLPSVHHHLARIKCANHRCGTGSKVRSEVCLVHNMPEMLQEEQNFVPTMK